MLKEAIEKIQSLCKPEVVDVDGTKYSIGTDGAFMEIQKELFFPQPKQLCSLDALVALIQTEAIGLTGAEAFPLYISVTDHNRVSCFSKPIAELRFNRVQHYDVGAKDIPGWDNKVTMSFEEAMIALRTRFEHTLDTDYALKLLSDITTGSKVTYNDNGIAQSVVTRKGIDLQTNANIKPIITLRPYRSFQEIEQPESLYLIRISERGITFVEADGGMWRLEARKRIASYLSERLAEQINDGYVVVMV